MYSVHHCLLFISSSIILNNSGFFLNPHSSRNLWGYLNFNCILSSFADCCFQKSISSDLLTLTPLITASSSAPTELARFLATALALALGAVGLDLDLALVPNSSIFFAAPNAFTAFSSNLIVLSDAFSFAFNASSAAFTYFPLCFALVPLLFLIFLLLLLRLSSLPLLLLWPLLFLL